MHNINQSYGFLLGKALQQMEDKFADTLIPFQINARQYGVLLFIKANPYCSQKVIAEKLQIDRTTMVSHVDLLEKLGYVERTKNPNDRRAHSLLITENGNNVLESCWTFLVDIESEVLSPLSENEKQLFGEMLIKIWRSSHE